MKYLILFGLLALSSCASVNMQTLELECQNTCAVNNDVYIIVKEVPQINYKNVVTGENYECQCKTQEFWM